MYTESERGSRALWYFSTMRTTIDRAGRVVIPKAVRDEAGLEAGAELEIEFRDGRIEIAPAIIPMRILGSGSAAVVDTDVRMPALAVDDVRAVLDHVRR